ncbi:hypothetical protein [Bacillus pseudomycoides]|nr:hypothetical protein [Bacillus pseudomycoides]
MTREEILKRFLLQAAEVSNNDEQTIDSYIELLFNIEQKNSHTS